MEPLIGALVAVLIWGVCFAPLWWPEAKWLFSKRTPVVRLAGVMLDSGVGWSGSVYSPSHQTGVAIDDAYHKSTIKMRVDGQSVPLTANDRRYLYKAWKRFKQRFDKAEANAQAAVLAERVEQLADRVERFGDNVVAIKREAS